MVAIRGSRSGASGTKKTIPSDEEIRGIIVAELAMAIRQVILELFGLVNTMLIDEFDEPYATVIQVVASASLDVVTVEGIQRGKTILYWEFSNTKPSEFRDDKEPIIALIWIYDAEGSFCTCSCPIAFICF